MKKDEIYILIFLERARLVEVLKIAYMLLPLEMIEEMLSGVLALRAN